MTFDFTPDPKVLLALTRTPMQPLDALCELIDNAIDSFAIAKIQGIVIDNPLIIIDLPTRKQLSNGTGVVRIRDNGPGMNAADAEKAIKAGFSGNNPYDTLGLFGMGFNISTGKLGNTTTFMTARKDSGKYIRTVIDLNKINAAKSYSLEAQEIDKGDSIFPADSQGTIIEVSNWWPAGDANNGFVDKLIQYGMPKVRAEIGRRYATILRESKARIMINGEKCEPFEHCVWDEKRSVTKNGDNIPAKIYIDKVLGSSKRCTKCTAIIPSDTAQCPACGNTGYRTIDEHVRGWIGIQRYTGYEAFYQNMDITIMGRRTFREIENLTDAGNIYPTTKNFVFTHAERLPFKEYTPVNGDVVEFVRQLGTDNNIWIIGGNTILAPLLDADMVDQMIIQIAPVLLGDGIPLFKQKEALKRFHLDAIKKYGQFAELIYSKR